MNTKHKSKQCLNKWCAQRVLSRNAKNAADKSSKFKVKIQKL